MQVITLITHHPGSSVEVVERECDRDVEQDQQESALLLEVTLKNRTILSKLYEESGLCQCAN